MRLRDKVERVIARASLCYFCRDWAAERAASLMPDKILSGECDCEQAKRAVRNYRRRQARVRKRADHV